MQWTWTMVPLLLCYLATPRAHTQRRPEEEEDRNLLGAGYSTVWGWSLFSSLPKPRMTGEVNPEEEPSYEMMMPAARPRSLSVQITHLCAYHEQREREERERRERKVDGGLIMISPTSYPRIDTKRPPNLGRCVAAAAVGIVSVLTEHRTVVVVVASVNSPSLRQGLFKGTRIVMPSYWHYFGHSLLAFWRGCNQKQREKLL